ncbi:hypothetical protein [Corynebacterium cystitidis]|uniref:hypothetical protein n=1 Tax=Corynebacterium cystitidis TaxID=35757 RepID=UPI00211EDCD0|nr:hypothetical protein [Corynebacterium cystitidis]
MSGFPTLFEVTHIKREVTRRKDALNNWVEEETRVQQPVRVAGWARPSTDEPKLAGHDRRTVRVELFAPVGVFKARDAVLLPDYEHPLEVIGDPERYEANPFGWSPSLEVVNLGGVE